MKKDIEKGLVTKEDLKHLKRKDKKKYLHQLEKEKKEKQAQKEKERDEEFAKKNSFVLEDLARTERANISINRLKSYGI